MSYRSVDPSGSTTLQTSLLNNDVHTYVHLIKFEKPSVNTEVGYKQGSKPSRKANTYSYLTDGGFVVSFNDGSVPSDGSAENGAQDYVPGKVLSVGTVSETIEAKASTMSLTLAASALSASVTDTFTITSSTVAGSTDLLESGFSVGDTVEFSGSGANNGVYVRIDSFSNENKTFNYTTISGTVTTQSSVNYTLSFASEEIASLTASKEGTDYSNYLNREVFIYRAHINPSTGALIGSPFLIFKGIITGSSFDDKVLNSAKVTWTLTSHWGDFVQVTGRITSDHAHRGLDISGVPSEDAVIRPEYVGDLGFRHAEQAINIMATYQTAETRYKMKRKGGLSGLLGGKKLVEYTEMVDRDVDLEFNLGAKYIPVIYGVQKATGIPFFADGEVDDATKIYVAHAISEGPVHGILDLHVDSNPIICINGPDFADRNTGDDAPVLCVGRADRGDVLRGGASIDPNTAIEDQIVEEAEQLVEAGVYADLETAVRMLTGGPRGYNSGSITHTAGGGGILHENKINLDSPLPTELTFHAGLSDQASDSLFTIKGVAKKFKVQSILYPDQPGSLYWGPAHQVLDTAYSTMNFTIGAGEFTIPDYEFIVKGRVLDCYNYDYSYSGSGTHTDFKLGDYVTLHKTDDDTQLGSENVQIIDKWSFYNSAGTLRYRFRFSKNLQLQDVRGDTAGDVKNFYMRSIANTAHKWYFSAYDNIVEDAQSTPEPIETQNFDNLSTITSGLTLQVITGNAGLQRGKISGLPINDPQFKASRGVIAFDIVYPSPYGTETFSLPYYTYTSSTGVILTTAQEVSQFRVLLSKLDIAQSYVAYAADAVKLNSNSSTTDDEYNNFELAITRIETSTGIVLQEETRTIVDYDGSNRIARLSSALPFRTDSTNAYKYTMSGEAQVSDGNDLFPSAQDKRVSINPAIQLLDYLTNKRYGKGLDIENDIDLASFLSVARSCDQQSKVTVIIQSGTAPTVGDKYKYPATGDIVFQGTVESTKQVTFNSSTFQEVTFKDVIGKLLYRWNDYRKYKPNEVLYYEGTAFTTSISSEAGERVDSTSRDSLISNNALNDSTNTFTLTKVGSASTTFDIFLNSADPYGTASTNPAIRRSSPTGFNRTGYSLYDSDDCVYWVYLGWDEPEQRYVTRHQTNLTVDTSQPVFNNINAMLEQFGGMLRYSNGKYALALKTGAPADSHFDTDFTAKDISEDDIIGSVKVQDSGSRKTYNSLNATIVDPANKFGGRSITFMNSEYLKQDRGVKKQGNYNIPGISNYFNARMNIKQQLDESRYGLTVKFTLDQKGYLLLAGDIIRLTYSRFGWSNKYFRINSLNFQADGLVQVVADEHNNNAYIIDHLESSRGAQGLEGGGQGTFAPAVPSAPTSATAPSQDKAGQIELSWTNGTNFNSKIHRTQIARAPEADNVSAPDASLSNVTIIAEVQTSTFLDSDHERTTNSGTGSNEALPTKYDYWVRHLYNTTGTTGTSNPLNKATTWLSLGEGHALPTTQTEISDGITIGSGGITMDTNPAGEPFIMGGMTDYNTGDGFYLGYDSNDYKFVVGSSTEGEKLVYDGTNLSLEGGQFVVTDSGGTAPSISGTTLAGAGILLKNDGDVLFGDSAGNYVFFDESEGDLTVKGDVTATSLTLTDGATVGNLNASSIEGVTQASFTSIGATAYNPEVNGSRVTWTIPANDSGNNWNHKLVSDYGFIGGALVSFKINKDNTTNSRYMVGLSEHTTGTSYDNIDYAIFINSNTDVRAYENATNAQQLKSSVVAGDVCTITYDGTKVRYYINQSVVRTVDVSSAFSGPLYAHVALDNEAAASVEHRIDNLEFGAHASVKQQIQDNITVGSGGLTFVDGGSIKGGLTGFNVNSDDTNASGFFLGYDTDAYKFSIGDEAEVTNGQRLLWDGTNLSVTGKIVGGSIQSNNSDPIPDTVFTRSSNTNIPTGDEEGAFIDLSSGKFVFGDAESFISFATDPNDANKKELDIKGVLAPTELDFSGITDETLMPSTIKARGYVDGSIGVDALSDAVWDEISERTPGVIGGFYATDTDPYLGAEIFVGLPSTPDHGSSDVTLKVVISDTFTYPVNFSYGSTGTQVKAQLQYKLSTDSTYTNFGSVRTFYANPVVLQYATRYTVNGSFTETLTTGTQSEVTNGTKDIVDGSDYDFRVRVFPATTPNVFLQGGSGGANDSSGTPIQFEASEGSIGAGGGELTTLDKLTHTNDADTYLSFPQDDRFEIYVGGQQFLQFDESTTDTISLYKETSFSENVSLADNKSLHFGASDDLSIKHYSAYAGSAGYITNSTGALYLDNDANTHPITLRVSDNQGTKETYLDVDPANTRVNIYKDLVVSGDLTVSGATTTVNTNDLTVADKEITLNYHATNDTSSTADGAGITIQDAVNSTTDASILWNAANDRFNFSHGIGLAAGELIKDTGDSGNYIKLNDDTSSHGINALTLTSVSGINFLLDTNNNDSQVFNFLVHASTADSATQVAKITDDGSAVFGGTVTSDNGFVGRGGDSATSGQLLNLHGTSLNQTHSGTIRLTEGHYESSPFFQGAYMTYDGANNAFRVGTHDTANQTLSDDVEAFYISRGSSNVFFQGRVLATSGTAAAPAYSFTGDTNTGLYRYTGGTEDRLGISTNGVLRANFGSHGIESSGNVYTGSGASFRNYGGTWNASTGLTGNGFIFENTADSTTALSLTADGDATFLGKIKSEGRQEYNDAYTVKVTKTYTGALDSLEYQKLLSIVPSGNSHNYEISGTITAQSAGSAQVIDLHLALRSQTLPDLVWEAFYDEKHHGTRFIDPLLWTKETSTAEFILAYQVLSGVTIYGTVTIDLIVRYRNSDDDSDITVSTASEQTVVDTGFTSNSIAKVKEVSDYDVTFAGAGIKLASSSIQRTTGSSNLNIWGGAGAGANIELYGDTHSTAANKAYYDASEHRFRHNTASPTYLTLTSTQATFSTDLVVNSGTDDLVAQFVSTDNKAGISIKDDDTTVYLSAENAVGSFGFNLGANANNLNIDSAGNIGIGVGNPDHRIHMATAMSSTPTNIIYLEVTGSTNTDGGGGALRFDTSATNTNDSAFYASIEGVRSTSSNGSNELRFFTADANISGGTPTQKMVIDQTGAVGIATGSPTSGYKLHVNGNILANSATLGVDGGDRIKISNRATNDVAVESFAAELFLSSGYNGISFEGSANTTLMKMDDTGNFGIGTDAPNRLLHVAGNSRFTGSNHTFGDSTKTATTLDIIATNTDGSPARTTLVKFQGYENRAQGLFFTDSGHTTKEWFVGLPYSNAGLSAFQIGFHDTSGSLQPEYSANSLVRVLKTGNVGIGETNPVSPLHINALSDTNYYTVTRSNGLTVVGTNIDVDTDAAGNIDIVGISRTPGNSTGYGPSLTFSQNLSQYVDGYEQVIGAIKTELLSSTNTSANSAMRFYTATGTGASTSLNERMTILNTGNVGIGTDNPNTLLHLKSSTPNIKIEDQDGTDQFGTLYQSAGQTILQSRNGTNNGVIAFKLNDGTTVSESMRIHSNGNVGIGTTSPGATLDVDGTLDIAPSSGDAQLKILNSANVGRSLIYFSDPDGTGGRILYNHASNYLSFETNGTTEAMRIDSSGRVGIGTTSPGEKLEVVGNVEAEEFIGDIRGATLFKAQAGEALSKGDVVYISGISGNTTVVSKADADDSAKMPAFGIAAAAASANNPVDVYTSGILSGIDTSAFSEGDELFVSTTAGVLTNSAPTGESAALQKIGKVTRSASNGSIFIIGAGRTNAVPNLNEGKLFVGNSSNQAVADNTIHVDIANSRVGIGTTSPSRKFEVHENNTYLSIGEKSGYTPATYGPIFQTNANALVLPERIYIYNSNVYLRRNSTSANLHGDGGIQFSYYNTTTQEGMRLDNSGRLGIGTTSPGKLLDVEGTARFGDSNFKITLDGTAAGGYFKIGTTSNDDSLAQFGAFGGSFELNTTQGNGFVFKHNAVERMRLTSGGLLGIGTTSPSEKLHVKDGRAKVENVGNATGTYAAEFVGTPTYQVPVSGGVYNHNQVSHGVLIKAGGTNVNNADSYPLRVQTFAGTDILIVEGRNERVGIGTTSPNYDLDVSGTINSSSIYRIASRSAINWDNANTNLIVGPSVAGDTMSFRIGSNSSVMVIDSSSNIGIRTNSPTTKLTVADTTGGDALLITGNSGNEIARLQPVSGATNRGELLIKEGTANDTRIRLTTENNTSSFINTNSSFGIGTNAPSKKLHVAAVAQNQLLLENTESSGASRLTFKATSNRTASAWIQSTQRGTTSNEVDIQIGDEDGTIATFNEGNVGIGTLSPTGRLHIQDSNVGIITNFGVGLIEATDAQLDLVSSSGGTWGSAINFVEGASTSANTNIWSIARQTTGGAGDSSLRFNFGTSNQHDNPGKVIFTSTGNVGIGYASPTNKLDVLGTISSTDIRLGSTASGEGIIRHNPGTGNSGIGITTGSLNSSGIKLFVEHTSDGGGVGIGTTSPAYLLHTEFTNTDTSLSGGSGGNWGSQGIRIENTSSGVGTMSLAHFRTNDSDWHVGAKRVGTNQADFIFAHEGSTEVTIDHTGKVGIGTTSPEAALHTIEHSRLDGAILQKSQYNITSANISTFNEYISHNGPIHTNGSTTNIDQYGYFRGYQAVYGNDGTNGYNPYAQGAYSNPVFEFVSNNRGTISLPTDSAIRNGYLYQFVLGNSGSGGTNGGVELTNSNTTLLWGITSSNDIHFTTNVGIGTDAPADPLHVVGDIRATARVLTGDGTVTKPSFQFVNSVNTGMYRPAADEIGFVNNASESMRIDADGKVGINVTDPLELLHINGGRVRIDFNGGHTSGNIGPSNAALDLYNNLQANTDEKGSVLVFSDNYYDGNNYIKTTRAAIKGGTDTTGNTADGFLAFYTDATGANSMPERMRIDRNGNVGIGTSSPAYALDISGGKVQINDGGATWFGSDSTGGFIRTFNGNTFRFLRSDSSESMRIDSSGNVGIGTNSPTHRLHIVDSAGSYTGGDQPIAVIEAPTDHRHLLKVKNTNANTNASAPRAGIDLDAANHQDSTRARAILDVRSRTSAGNGGDTNLTTPFDFSIYTNNHDTITASEGEQASSVVPGGTLALHIDENQHVGVGTSTTTHNFTSDVGAIGSNTYAGHFIGSLRYTPPNSSTFNQVSNGVLIQAGGYNAAGTSYALMVQDRDSTELFAVNGNTGAVRFHDAFTFPTTDGQANQILKTNGSGVVSWADDTGGATLSNGVDNRVVTASGANTLNGEANLTFDGSALNISGVVTASGRIHTSNSLYSADVGGVKFRQYQMSTGDAGGDFLLGKIENSSGTDGAVEGIVHFTYDYGTTTNQCTLHFSFAQRQGTARGSWWYEHDDQDNAGDRVHVRLIDDGSGNMFVWVTCTDFAIIAVETWWRQGSQQAASGSLTSGTLTTGTTLFDTANDPTAEFHIGKLYAHDDVSVIGALSATTKSFDIEHPTKEGMRLHHGSLEGPEHGVYVRGHATENVIELPEYWTGLVDEKSITVQLTANGRFQKLYVEKVENNKVYLRNASWFSNKIDCYYMINATRKDIAQFEVEYGNA